MKCKICGEPTRYTGTGLCRKHYDQARRRGVPLTVKQRKRTYERIKKYRIIHRVEIRERDKEYLKNNKDIYNAQKRRYFKKHKEYLLANMNLKRAYKNMDIQKILKYEQQTMEMRK